MPRRARKKCESGVYHVMIRGINRQDIFEDDEDALKFLELLMHYRNVCGYQIYAYCLMENHVHIVIHEGQEDIGSIFKRIGAAYVYYYNIKYHRKGHLFQDRFRSEPIYDDEQLATVIRYVHMNPVKADIVKSPEEYRLSSYSTYVHWDAEFGGEDQALVDCGYILDIFGKEEFFRFTFEKNNDVFLDDNDTFRNAMTDSEARKVMAQMTECENSAQFQALDRGVRNAYLAEMKEQGISINQLCRLTGLSYGTIQKAHFESAEK